MGFFHTEEVTQLLRSAGYREWRRVWVVVMAPSQTMDWEGRKGDAVQIPGKKIILPSGEVVHSHLTTDTHAGSVPHCTFRDICGWNAPIARPSAHQRVALLLRITFSATFIMINMTICVELGRVGRVSAEGKRCMLGLQPAERVAFWEAVSCGQGLWGMQHG